MVQLIMAKAPYEFPHPPSTPPPKVASHHTALWRRALLSSINDYDLSLPAITTGEN